MSFQEFVVTARNLTLFHYAMFILGFLATVAPGTLIIYHFRPLAIVELDTLKIILLSAAITLPLLSVNFLAGGLVEAIVEFQAEDRDPFLFVCFLSTGAALYIPLLSAYWFGLGFRHFLTVMGGVELLLLVVVVIFVKGMKSLQKKAA